MRTSYTARVLPFWSFLIAIGLLGCHDQDTIRRYQVAHESPLVPVRSAARGASPTRTLAAIVPRKDRAWFFKAMASDDQIESIRDDFFKLVESLSFLDDGTPRWELPPAWTQAEGNQFRFATLKAADAEISVSPLPMRSDEGFDRYVLINVNRWLEQLSRPPLDADQLAEFTKEVELTDGKAVVFDSGSSASRAKPGRRQPSEQRSQAGDLTYDVPEGWDTAGPRPMRLATFTAERQGQKVEVAISRLGPNAGSLLANVNRWRGQIGLGEIEPSQLEETRDVIRVNGIDCDYIRLEGSDSREPRQSIFAVVIKRPDQTLFIKLTGDHRLAEDEVENFEKFVESIRFPQ